MSIIQSIATISVFERSPLTITDIQLAKARRYCVLYDRLQFGNSQLA